MADFRFMSGFTAAIGHLGKASQREWSINPVYENPSSTFNDRAFDAGYPRSVGGLVYSSRTADS